MPDDRLAYKILLNGTDYSQNLSEGSVKHSMNEYSSAEVVLANDGSVYTTTSAFGMGSSFVISASRDAGASYLRLYSGYVSSIETSVNGSNGSNLISIGALGGGGARKLYVSPNQVVMGPCDLGAALTGSPTDYNSQSWTSDSKGNYPNGLLYKTGYGLTTNSVTDVFASKSDLPSRVILTGKDVFETFDFFKETFALTFFMDDPNGSFSIYKDPIYNNFSSYALTLSTTDMTKYTIARETNVGAQQVLVVGNTPQIFSIFGNSGKEIRFSAAEAENYVLAHFKAAQQYEKQRATRSYVSFETYPITDSIIGRKITLDGPGMSSYGNVIGIVHNLKDNQWTMQVDCEARQETIGALFADVDKKLKQYASSDSVGNIYLLGIASRSGGINNQTPVAIGYGNDGDPSSSLRLQSGLAIRPLTARLTDTASGVEYIYLSLDRNDIRGRIKEFVLFGTTDTGGHLYDSSLTLTFNYQSSTDSLSFRGEDKWRRLTSSQLPGGLPFIASQFKTLNSPTLSYYWWKPVDMDKIYTWQVGSTLSSLPAPSSIMLSGTAMGVETKRLISRDDSSSANGVVYLSGTDNYIYMEFASQLPTYSFPGLGTWSFIGIDRLGYSVTGTINYYIWNNSSSAWQQWQAAPALPWTNSGIPAQLHNHYSTLGASYMDDLVDGDGRVRVLVRATGSGGTDKYIGNYYQFMITANPAAMAIMDSATTITEVAAYDPSTKMIFTSKPVNILWGLWMSGSVSGGTVVPNEDTLIWRPYGPLDRGAITPVGSASNVIPFDGITLQTAEHSAYKTFIRAYARRGQPEGIVNKSWYLPTDMDTNIVMESVEQQLANSRMIVVQYEYIERTVNTPPPSRQTIQASGSWISYSADMATGVPWVILDEYTPAYGVKLVINYAYLGTGTTYPALVRLTPDLTSRIDQGVCFDGRSDLHLMIKYYTASGAGTATFAGHGCGV